MFLLSCLLVLQPAAQPAPPAADPAMEKELQALSGTWKFTKLEAGGQPSPPQLLEKLEFIITPETLTFTDGSTKEATRYRLSLAEKPRKIDIIAVQKQPDGSSKDVVAPGVYELNGDVLKICFVKEGNRPVAFATKAGEAAVLMELKRAPAPAAK